jgi:hypothetical protein
MRKLTVEIEMNERAREELKPMFKDVQSYEVLETLKVNFEEGITVDLIEFNLKEDLSIHDMKSLGYWDILSVLRSEGKKHTCLVRNQQPEDSKEEFKDWELDLIYTTPIVMSNERYTCSVIGDNENLTKFVELMKTQFGKVVNMTFKKAAYQKRDILSILTDKQREVMMAAHKYGYYNFPKKITSEELSKKVNISKTTLVQHLRKAEERILDDIMTGYS